VYPRTLKDGGKVWDAIVHIPNPNTGKRKQVQKTFKTQRQAKKWVNDQQGAIADGTAVPPSNTTVAMLMEHWLEHIVRPHRSGQTYVNYEGTVRRHINSRLGHVKVQKLSAAQVQQWQTALLDAGIGARSVQLAHINLGQALKVAVRQRLVARNVTDFVELPRYQAREMNFWTADEATKFISVADQSIYGPVWLLALVTGLRKGELLGLRWQDLDLEQRVLRVRQTVGVLHGKVVFKQPKTLRSRRDVDLPEGIVHVLLAYKARQNARRLQLGPRWQDHDLVFCSERGTPINPDNCDQDFNRLIVLAEVKRIRIHDMRHTYATLAILSGIPVHVVSQSMGHADISTTLRTYSHVLPQQRKELASRMGSLLLKPQEAIEAV
jgi:integrase